MDFEKKVKATEIYKIINNKQNLIKKRIAVLKKTAQILNVDYMDFEVCIMGATIGVGEDGQFFINASHLPTYKRAMLLDLVAVMTNEVNS